MNFVHVRILHNPKTNMPVVSNVSLVSQDIGPIRLKLFPLKSIYEKKNAMHIKHDIPIHVTILSLRIKVSKEPCVF